MSRYNPPDRITVNQLTAMLGIIVSVARAKMAKHGAGLAAREAVREAERIVSDRPSRANDRCDRFIFPAIDAPGKVERMRLLVSVLTRRAA